MHAGFGERRVVIRIERREMLGIALRGAVAAEKFILKEKRYLRHYGIAVFVFSSGNLYRRQQVFLRIGAQGAYGQLAAREDHGFVQVLKHE